MTAAPYDIEGLAVGAPDPRVRWPTTQQDVQRMNHALLASTVPLFRQADGLTRRTVVVAANVLQITALTLAGAWLAAARSRSRGLSFDFRRPSLVKDLLESGRADGALIYDVVRRRFAAQRNAPPHPALRRLAHGVRLNRGLGLPWRRATMVLNPNHLLRAEAMADRSRRFVHETGERPFAAGPVGPDAAESAALVQWAAAFAAAAAGCLDRVGARPDAGWTASLQDATAAFLIETAGWIGGLDRHWTPPAELWSGTGGNFSTRLCRDAVRRGGGVTVAFEHGGGGHIHADASILHLQEFALCDRFVVDTKAKARLYGQGLSEHCSIDGRLPIIEAARTVGTSFSIKEGLRSGSVERVMTVTTAFVGETQYPLLPLMSDPIYADWQGRLNEGLAAQGFQVACKQHPEGLRRGEPLVMARNIPYLRGRFGEMLGAADAFVFDYPATTTLWEAVCTDKPVVFIDLGLAAWIGEIWDDFRARVAVVPGRLDDDARPQVDFAAVTAALRSAPYDGGAFARKHLVGP